METRRSEQEPKLTSMSEMQPTDVEISHLKQSVEDYELSEFSDFMTRVAFEGKDSDMVEEDEDYLILSVQDDLGSEPTAIYFPKDVDQFEAASVYIPLGYCYDDEESTVRYIHLACHVDKNGLADVDNLGVDADLQEGIEGRFIEPPRSATDTPAIYEKAFISTYRYEGIFSKREMAAFIQSYIEDKFFNHR